MYCVAKYHVLFTEFVDVGVAVNFYVVSYLCDINSVVHVDEALAFERDAEVIFDLI